MSNRHWYEDDTPRDLNEYLEMTDAERNAEIERLEKEHEESKKRE